MDGKTPFVLLDDARATGASAAQLYVAPRRLFVARRPEEVARVLAEAEDARLREGAYLAGYLAYEAGLAMEPRLAGLAPARSGAMGPLVWLGLFDAPERIAADAMPEWLAARAQGTATIGPLEPQLSMAQYRAGFDHLKQAIRAGDIYQANYTMALAGPARGDPLALYAAIRPEAAAPYGGLIFDGSHWLLSFSPELFFSLKGRAVRARPMKGTRPRGATPAEDAALAADLAASAKDKAENLMIVDLMRNDLSRVALPGTVKVEQPFAVEHYPTVHQMVSTVVGQLPESKGAMDLLAALFPCGSITGAPKIRAMELIDVVEPAARGPYCGAIGRIGPDGDAAFNVAIRTIRLTPGENQRHKAVLGVGGAIVADSEAVAEWRECLVKGAFVRGAAGGHDLIETMRFDPEDGIALLEGHLARLSASAKALGFAFDRHEARNRIQALCFELEAPARLRLLLGRDGTLALEAAPLPPPLPDPVPCLAVDHPTVAGDWRLCHKTSDRGFYESALAEARAAGAAEAVLVRRGAGDDAGNAEVTEGSWTSLFVERDGLLFTPPLASGLLPGVLRAQLLAEGKAREARLSLADLAGGFFIGNALRGLLPARLIKP